MARIVAKNCGVLLAARDISGRSNSATLTMSSEAPEVTCFTEGTRTRLPAGLRDVELTVDGFYDAAASQVNELFDANLGASAWAGLYPQGVTASLTGYEFQGILTEYAPNAAVADAVAMTATIAGCAPLLHSKVIGTCAAYGEGASACCASVDFATAATGSVVGILRVHAMSGTNPDICACLQSSTDDATFVTAVVFIADTAPASNAGNIIYVGANTGTTNRYRRVRYIINGSATFTVTSGSMVV